ncbi:MAG: hypothetical protein V3R87_08835 [Dehalococcoidia bacterium]
MVVEWQMTAGRIRNAIVCLAVSVAAFGSGAACATPGAPAEPSIETSRLVDLLRAVPWQDEWDIVFEDLDVLSEWEGVVAPAREASLEEKVQWYSAIQGGLVVGLSMPLPDVWGFDTVDVDAQLTLWNPLDLKVVSGDLDTAALAAKLRGYGYEEAMHKEVPVFTWTPDAPEESVRFLPKAFGIIEDDSPALVVMAGSVLGGSDVAEDSATIEAAIDAYRGARSLADNEELVGVVEKLGRPGAAYLYRGAGLDRLIQEWGEDVRESILESVGPGHLDVYSMLAVARGLDSGRETIEFVLVYEDRETAGRNVAVVADRLEEGRSLTLDRPLGELFTVREVRAEGEYLRARVELIGEAAERERFFVDLVYQREYWFLTPGKYRD